jgi:hypothetical protein
MRKASPYAHASPHAVDMQAHTAISSCLAGRVERYSLNESSRAKVLLDTAERLSNEEMYDKSLQIEPRGKIK